MGVLEFLVPFYLINTALVVFSSDLKMDPLNLYPNTGLLIPNLVLKILNLLWKLHIPLGP